MDFCFPYDDCEKLSQSDYKRCDITDLSTKISPGFDVHVDTPRIRTYPSRFLHRGRYSRRRRARLLPFSRRSPRYRGQFSPHGYNNYYNVSQDYCPDQCACSSQIKRKAEIGYLPYSNYGQEDFEDYYVSEHQKKMTEWRMSPEYFIEQQRDMTDTSSFEADYQMQTPMTYDAIDFSETPPKTSITLSNPCNKTKHKMSTKKVKKRNTLEHSNENNDCLDFNNVSATDVPIMSKPLPVEWYLLTSGNTNNEITFETLNLFENSPSEKLLNKSEDEVDIAVKNMQLDHIHNISVSDQSIPLQKEMQNNTSILSTIDEQGTLHFETGETANDYAFLDNLITELEQANNLHQNKNIEVDTVHDLHENNSQIVTFPESESNDSETNLKVPDNQFASLLQQNQMLTDLLSKVISNSDIISINKEKESQAESNPVQPIPINHEENLNQFQAEGCHIHLNDEQKLGKFISNEIVNNVSLADIGISNQPSQTDIKSAESYQICKIEDTVNTCGFSNSDFLNSNEISHFETSLSSITNYILDEPVSKTVATDFLEKTTENILEFGDEISAHEEDSVKTLVRKTTLRRRTSPKLEGTSEISSHEKDNVKTLVRKTTIRRRTTPKIKEAIGQSAHRKDDVETLVRKTTIQQKISPKTKKVEQNRPSCNSRSEQPKTQNQCTRSCCNKNMRDAETQTIDIKEFQSQMSWEKELDTANDTLHTRKLRSNSKPKQNYLKLSLDDIYTIGCKSPELCQSSILIEDKDAPVEKAIASAPARRPNKKRRTRKSRKRIKKKRTKKSTPETPKPVVTLD